MQTIRSAETRHKFLTVLVETGGNVGAACKSVRISRTAAYAWRRDDPEFAAAWAIAMDMSTEALEDEVVTRALTGRNRPVFYQGKVQGHIRERSDLLLMFMLKGRKPNVYRDRVEVTSNGSPLAPSAPLIEHIGAASAAAAKLMATPLTIEPAPTTVPDDTSMPTAQAQPEPAPWPSHDGSAQSKGDSLTATSPAQTPEQGQEPEER